MINLYSTGCPKCKILEMKLNQKKIVYSEINNVEAIRQKNILSVPVLEVDGQLLNFADAVNFVNSYQEDA